ncbi:hypothetical protein WG906_00930 [Pedobacter sp. P351]|uniref:hypothetical protein n=1 Tax=Pedobacter superstes TaxID=3133441 RepID=UPI0030B02939
MKFLLHLILAILLCKTAGAQSLNSERGDLKSALTRAQNENKPLCLLMIPSAEIPVPVGFINIRKEKRITDVLNKNFINFIPAAGDTVYAYIKKKYPVERTPVLLFLNGEGELFYRFFPNFRNAESLLTSLSLAQVKFKSDRSVAWYEKEYKKGVRDTAFLKAFIAERETLGIYFNHWLVQEYAQQLTLKSINTIPVTAFLLHTGLIYGSPLYTIVTSKKGIRDSAWASFPLKERSEINRRTSLNTFGEAVKRKDAKLAQQAAEYLRNLWSNKDYNYSQYIYDKELIRFYTAIKDTSQLVNRLIYFTDRNFSKVTIDTLQKYRRLYPELRKELAVEDLEKPPLFDPEIGKLVIKSANAGLITRAPMELNNAAWIIYTSSKNKELLSKALSWSQTSIKLDPKPEFYDTLAHLLYRLEFYYEAEQMELKAMKLAETNKRYSVKYKEALEKIKTRKL